MTQIINYKIVYGIRLGLVPGLIFFILFSASSCREAPQQIDILWKDSQAVGITVPEKIIGGFDRHSIKTGLRIYLEGERGTAVLGEQRYANDELHFLSAIPLSRGRCYDILFADSLLGKITIPPRPPGSPPTLVAIYPSKKILPENILKIYLHFSQPMREGESLRYINLLNSENDTLRNIFLELQPELWNTEGTVLTLWLDPGRIKRDLIPNRTMGNPLRLGKKYRLAISSSWNDVHGQPLSRNYDREFTVGIRDSLSPDPDRWTFSVPNAGTTEPLVVSTGESLDYFLLQETIEIIGANQKKVPGSFEVSNEETMLRFYPAGQWGTEKYQIKIASHLEDLAGNNLDHVFDRDIKANQAVTKKSVYQRTFIVK